MTASSKAKVVQKALLKVISPNFWVSKNHARSIPYWRMMIATFLLCYLFFSAFRTLLDDFQYISHKIIEANLNVFWMNTCLCTKKSIKGLVFFSFCKWKYVLIYWYWRKQEGIPWDVFYVTLKKLSYTIFWFIEGTEWQCWWIL